MSDPEEKRYVDGWLVTATCAAHDDGEVMMLLGIVDGHLTFARTWTNQWGELQSERKVVNAPLNVIRALIGAEP